MKGIVSIPKIPGSMTLDTQPLTIAPENLVTELLVDRTGNGAIEAIPTNDNLDVEIRENRIKLIGRTAGTAQLLVRALDGVNHARTKTQTIDINLQDIPSGILANNSWDIIQRTIHAGFGKAPGWQPGDKIPRALSGTVGVTDVSGDYYDVLLDIDHNPDFEGAHNAQFGLAWYAADGITPIAFVDDKYNTSYYDARRDFRMNPTWQNLTTGYSGMQLRSVIQEFFGAITDDELKRKIVACPKMVDDGVFIAAYVSDPKDVRELRDVIWLPNGHEVFADATAGNTYWPQGEAPVTETYPMFTTNPSRIAYAFNDLTKPVFWWMRSRSTTGAGYFRTVNTNGGTNGYIAYHSLGARPCYMVS